MQIMLAMQKNGALPQDMFFYSMEALFLGAANASPAQHYQQQKQSLLLPVKHPKKQPGFYAFYKKLESKKMDQLL
jgi:hypothetical protein